MDPVNFTTCLSFPDRKYWSKDWFRYPNGTHLSLFMVSYHRSWLFTPFVWTDRKKWNWLSYGYLSDVGSPHKVSLPPLNWLKYRYRHLSGITVYMLPPFSTARVFHPLLHRSEELMVGVDWDLGIWVMWVLHPQKWPIYPRLLYQYLSLFPLLFWGWMDHRTWLPPPSGFLSHLSFPMLISLPPFFGRSEPIATGIDQDINGIQPPFFFPPSVSPIGRIYHGSIDI